MGTDETTSTLTIKVSGIVEMPPEKNRENFRQSVIETVLFILRTHNVSVEYIGYKADSSGVHPMDGIMTEYEDCVYVSLSVSDHALNPMGGYSKDDLVGKFVEIFENKTHRHLEIDSTVIRTGSRQRIIEMSSDWKLYLKHG